MGVLERLKSKVPGAKEADLQDCIECACDLYFQKRFPFGDRPETVEPKYENWIYRAALDLYNKAGAEGETRHVENGVTREYDGAWISSQLISEIVPKAGVLT